MFQKTRRIEDPAIIAQVQSQPCCACVIGDGVRKSIALNPVRLMRISDAHHITTVGAGGDDALDNLIALCRNHHGEAHNKGMRAMVRKYPGVKEWITRIGRVEFLTQKK